MNFSATSSSETGVASALPAVLPVVFKDTAALRSAYISLFTQGGIFVSSKDNYRLGDEVYLLLTLPDDAQRHPVAGRVAWITPPGAGYGRLPGVGVSFQEDGKADALKSRIEDLLQGELSADHPTLTL